MTDTVGLDKVMTELFVISNKIMVKNPRVSDYKTNSFYKQLKRFITMYEGLEPSEKKEMLGEFYSNYYLDSITSEDWLTNDEVKMSFGDKFELNLTAHYRTASDIDSKTSQELKYRTVKVLHSVATEAVKELLSEKISFLEKELNIKPVAAAASTNNGQDMLKNGLSQVMGMLGLPAGTFDELAKMDMKEAFGKVLQSPEVKRGFAETAQTMLNTPEAAAIIRGVAQVFPASDESKQGVMNMIERIQTGETDIQSLISGVSSSFQGPQGPIPAADPHHTNDLICMDDVCIRPDVQEE